MPDTFALATFLPYQLAYISERVSQRLSQEYSRSHGLSVSEWRVLVNLHSLGTASVRVIQIFTNLEKSRVSRAVGRLEASGLVQKQTRKHNMSLSFFSACNRFAPFSLLQAAKFRAMFAKP